VTVPTCSHCAVPLRSDNTRGACAECISRGRAPRVQAQKSVARRFREAARALNLDPDKIIEEWQSQWLQERAK
jgi:hypothetical protein